MWQVKKKKTLCLNQKIALIRVTEKVENMNDFKRRFGLSPSTVPII